MGAIRPPRKAKLICGLFSNDVDLLRRARQLLARRLGEIDTESELWPFDTTDYYEPEMGPDLQRMFVSFASLIDPGQLAHIKHETNDLEAAICHDMGAPPEFRLVNLDPGYITLSKLVLATTKDYSHRIYIGQGMYAESTLHWQSGAWQAWPWTYPDFAGERYHGFLTQVRERLREQLSEVPACDTKEAPDA
ncbi:MAG: DUF4416 family protein [Phycisphaerae bacterium]|nr:DUF4416 family protein [Phycisphaerae bacterium]